jgi:hypothetical protein
MAKKRSVSENIGRAFRVFGPAPPRIEVVGEIEAVVDGIDHCPVEVALVEPSRFGNQRVVELKMNSSMPGDSGGPTVYLTPYEAKQLGSLLLKASEVRVAPKGS